MSDDKHYHGHRQRLREKFAEAGPAALADYEMLELTLTYILPRKDVKPIAKALLEVYKDLAGVLEAPLHALQVFPGLGEASGLYLKTIQGVMLKAKRGKTLQRDVFSHKLDLLDYLYNKVAGLQHEEFHVLYLDNKNRLMGEDLLFRGTLNAAAVYPREVIKAALAKGAAGLVLLHNHPSGDPSPSADDDTLTAEIAALAQGLGLAVVDHLIIGDGVHFSYHDHGKI